MKSIYLRIGLGFVNLVLMTLGAFGQSGNYFAGYQAGQFNTGSYSTFVGFNSAAAGNSGWNNTFLGYYSGRQNTSGSQNTFIGTYAGYVNSVGVYNTFVGYAAGNGHTAGANNSFFGSLAGLSTTTGGTNCFFGSYTGYTNLTGGNNAFYGFRAGYSNTTSNNSFFGCQAGEKNTTGTQNTFMGRSAGFANTTGNANVFIGHSTGDANTTGVNNTFAGQNAGGKNTSGNRNSFHGFSAGEFTSTGHDNTFVGTQAGRNNTTGSGNTALGYLAQESSSGLTNSTAIGNRAYVRASNSMVLGSINGENGATVTVKVGIGTATPGYNLHVNGTAAKPGGGSWTVASDKRLKKNIRPFTEGLKEIDQVNPVWFEYNGKAGLPTDKSYVGIIAQDMQRIAPHSVGKFVHDDGEGKAETYLDYDANALTYTLVNAVKELNAEIKKLKEEIAVLKGQPRGSIPEGSPLAKLWQNSPNPYASSTVIKYHIPEDASEAQIKIISMTGQEVYSRQLTEKGESQIEISNQLLSTGNYVYQLVVDGSVVDSKKMIFSK